MSRYEERTYRVGKKKPNIQEMKSQRERLRQDLEQFSARKPGAVVIQSLRERIKALDQEIADAEAERKRERAASAPGDEEGGPADDGPRMPQRATSTRFPPRGRTGGGV